MPELYCELATSSGANRYDTGLLFTLIRSSENFLLFQEIKPT